jgi:CelD/BcsL family acetyltransferase involved in cellulose biosynthesis
MPVMLHSITADLEAQWEDLAAAAGASPFVRPGWISAWAACFRNQRPRLLGVSDANRLVAALPLVVSGRAVRSPTNWHTGDFGSLSIDDDGAASLFQALLASRAATVDLGHIDAPDLRRFQAAARASRRLPLSWVQQESPFVDTTGAWDAYVSLRDTRWLRQLERRRTQLRRLGELVLDIQLGDTNLEPLLEEGFRLEATGWKAESGTAVLSTAVTRRFYWEVARWAARKGLLRLAFLRLDGRAIAFDFCLEDDRRHYFIKTGFDPSLKPQAPGLILRHDMIRRAFDLSLQSYELLGGAESYKLAWTNETRTRYRALAFRRSPLGLAMWLAYRHARPAAKRVIRAFRERGAGPGNEARTTA